VGNGKALERKEGEEHVAPCGALTDHTEAGAWARSVSVMSGVSGREAPGAIPAAWSAKFFGFETARHLG
jgi:hypothetical protein